MDSKIEGVKKFYYALIKNYERLKFCPLCGKELVFSPISGWQGCWDHGNFSLLDGRIIWVTKHAYDAKEKWNKEEK